MSLLEVSHVTQRFGGLAALDDVSFAIEPGIVSAVIGPNGAGKTTLFNVISGFQRPFAGEVRFDGRPITGLPPHQVAARGLVRTFQLVQLFPELTALANVEAGHHLKTRGGLWAALARPPAARRDLEAARENARELLAFTGLADSADRLAGTLTYGQQRLLEVARALAAGPRLLLLDEPAAGLNTLETERLAELIDAIVARGTTVLLIEHDMNLVMRIARQVIVLDFGRRIATGTPAQVQTDPAVLDAYLGSGRARTDGGGDA
jgi:branched-chain amino acid transport system ATP-binding protein